MEQETFIKPDTIDGEWLSPIPAERQWQEEKLREIFGHYPTASPKWQYMNGLIQNILYAKEMEKQQTNSNKCYHPLTERKQTSDTHFECTICGYNNY